MSGWERGRGRGGREGEVGERADGGGGVFFERPSKWNLCHRLRFFPLFICLFIYQFVLFVSWSGMVLAESYGW